MNRHAYIFVATVWLLLSAKGVSAKNRIETTLLERMWNYALTADTLNNMPLESYNYHRLTLHTDKRNLLMLIVPTMYDLARSKRRDFVSEYYDRVDYDGNINLTTKRLLSISTLPHSHRTMRTLRQYSTPTLYAQTIIDDHLISPFNRKNKKFYKYKTQVFDNGTADITYTPTRANTQLVSGSARIDTLSGRIIEAFIDGEYDHIKFRLFVNMNREGTQSLFPNYCYATFHFGLLGNEVNAQIKSFFGLERQMAEDSIAAQPLKSMELLRPQPLSEEERTIVDDYFGPILQKQAEKKDSTSKEDSNFLKNTMDVVTDNMLNKIKTSFDENRGNIQISPIFNPLYLRYSHSKGIIYKFDVKSIYALNKNSYISARTTFSYSLKQKRLYIDAPLRYYFNMKKNGFLGVDFRCGDKVFDSKMLEQIVRQQGDTVNWNLHNIDFFRSIIMNVHGGYDFSDKFSVDLGLHIVNRSDSKSPKLFKSNIENYYRSVSPAITLTYRPMGWEGPVINLDYERSIKGLLQSNMNYERWEIDANYIHSLTRLRRYYLRFGTGFYTARESTRYFCDFIHFHENNIPLGWDDDWTGEFELLRGEWYNASQYYVRGNFTWESPMLLISRLPLVGRYIEMERVYASALSVKAMTPYMETGYGFSTRFFSMAAFIATKEGKYSGFGCKFELELFRHW